MVLESQDPVARIEHALMAMRRERGGPHGHRGPHRPGEHGHPHTPRDRVGGAARFRLLGVLAEAPADARLGISEIAEAVGVDQPRASRLVNEAAEHGLVTRRADERDARRSVVELAPAGRTVLEGAREHRRTSVETALAGFAPDEREQFAALLGRFVDGWVGAH